MIESLLFYLKPENWKLTGKDKERAWAKHTLTGEELERALLQLDMNQYSPLDYKIANLNLDFKFNKINENEYEKSLATLKEEPYFKVLNGVYHETNSDRGTMVFELDWNDVFVSELISHGWNGATPDAVVDSWFEDACKQMFNEDVADDVAEEMPVTAYNRTRRKQFKGDTNEYS